MKNDTKSAPAPAPAPGPNEKVIQSAHPGPIHVAGRWVYPGRQSMPVDDALRAELNKVGKVDILQAA